MRRKNQNILFYLITTTLFMSCKSPSKCVTFKNGTFYTFSPITGNKIIIERKDTLQIETDVKSNVQQKNKIVWKTPCEYEILAISDNKSSHGGIDSFFSITPINVKIIEIGEDFYVFQARMDSVNKHIEYSDTIRVLK